MDLRRIAPLGVALALVIPASAGSQERTVPQGVTAGGADLSGLTLQQAIDKLKAEVEPKLGETLIIGVSGKQWKLTMAEAKFAFNKTKTAQAALDATPGMPDAAGGAAPKTDIPLVVAHSKQAVAAFVSSIDKKVGKPSRSATVKLGLKKMHLTRAKVGLGLDKAATAKLIDATLDDAAAPRLLHKRLSKVYPKTNATDLKKQYGTVITIDKSTFKLRLWKRLKLVRTYGVAVGQPAYPTPEGRFAIQDKQIDPVWSVPNSPWAGELGGTTVAGGSAANPLKARWMGITDGVGIHGTGEDYSIGSAASHGCIRMHVWDVKALYPRVPVGTTVIIGKS